MSPTPAVRRLLPRPLRALTVLLLAAACLPLAAADAGARTHRPACTATGRAHGSHACLGRPHGKGRHARRPHRAGKPHAHRHAKPGRTGADAPKRQGQATPAVCEDGSAPAAMGAGTFACDDGSEPACENGSEPTSTGDGAKLECAPDPETGPSFGEGCEADGECAAPAPPICEDGYCEAAESDEAS